MGPDWEEIPLPGEEGVADQNSQVKLAVEVNLPFEMGSNKNIDFMKQR